MKNLLFLLFIPGLSFLTGCKDYVDEYVTYSVNEPLFMSASEFRSGITIEQPKPIEKQGKIAFYKGYLYVSQPEKGIHVIDNRDSSNPRNVAFISLLGNADLHIRDNVLYADSYIDLVWFDVNDPAKPVFKGREEEVFPTALPPTENNFSIDYTTSMDRSKGIVVGWKVAEKTELIRTYKPRWWSWGGGRDEVYATSDSSSGSTGIVGSMSRFAIFKDYLYVVLKNKMTIFDLSDVIPRKIVEKMVNAIEVETIFSYKNCLFMGTPTGMLIYSAEDPLNPEMQSMFFHAYGCDPVVVENDIAYITVRTGNFCAQNSNELIIVDVSNIKKPTHIVSYNMKNPKGVGIDNGTLFLCDDGLMIFNTEDPKTIMHKDNILAHFKEIDGYDVIPFNNVLMLIADDGIYQYDYADIKNIKQLSCLPIGK